MAQLVSVVVETVTARFDATGGSLAERMGPTLAALARQTYPAEAMELLLVVDGEAAPQEVEALRPQWPDLRIVTSPRPNYFAAKNAGAAAASGAFVALLDGDCVPAPDWLETLMARFDPSVEVVAGRTRYEEKGWARRILSVPDFAYAFAAPDGNASGFNLNNVAFRRETLLANPLDGRIRRNGACYLLFHQLRAQGVRIVYEPGARTVHGLEAAGLGFLRKHFDRGYDSIAAYRADDRNVLKGTPYFRRFGALALPPIFLRRTALDWKNLVLHRQQMGFGRMWLPVIVLLAGSLRATEFLGALAAALRRVPAEKTGSDRAAGSPA
ncbi:MAG: hypothetical protein QOH81_1069 [Sphingomonadales bacterium]|jgi:glycosyltransferase involved in cell wall biosynthesis|nr:hypothetical protein [Sphingomonadales bacterium]